MIFVSDSMSWGTRLRSALRDWWPLLILAAVCVYFATYRISEQDPDKDELIASWTARKPSIQAVTTERLKQGHPPLYFVALRAWVKVWGHTYPAMFLMSAMLGFLTVPIIVLIGRELGLGRWSWAAGLLFCIHPTTIYFARYSRPWAGVILLTTLIFWLTLRCLREPQRRYWIGLAIVGLIGSAWNHALLIVWGGLLLGILTQNELRRRTRAPFWAAVGFALAAHGLFGLLCLNASTRSKPLSWIQTFDFVSWFKISTQLLGGKNITTSHMSWQWIVPLGLLAVLAFACFHLFAPGGAARRMRHAAFGVPDRPWLTAAWRMIAVAAVFPWVLITMTSWTCFPLLVYRYMSLVIPGMVLVAVSAHRLVRPTVAIAIFCMFAVLAVSADKLQIKRRPSGVGRAIEHLERHYEPGDVVLVFSHKVEEAIRLKTKTQFNCGALKHRVSPKTAWSLIDRYTRTARRVWVFMLWDDTAIIHTPEWSKRAGPVSHKYVAKTVELLRYDQFQPRSPAAPPAPTKNKPL